MRRISATLALLACALCWTGCANSSPAPSSPSNSPAAANSSSDAAGGSNISSTANTSAPATTGGKPTGIKPPMKDEKK